MDQEQILAKVSFTEEKTVKILKLKGSPYEIGFQHGYMLADKIDLMVNRTMLATAAYVARQSNCDNERAMEKLWAGQKAAEPFVPEEFMTEMKGIAEGAQAKGFDISLEQVLLWNTMYDQWCIYCHPYYWNCDGKDEDAYKPAPEAHPWTRAAGGCSSFCAWDEWAGGDGKMIFAKDEDNFNMPFQLENRMLMVVDPDEGYGHTICTYPGLIGLDGGFNEDGFEMMTQLSSMQYESMEGCGIALFTRILLTHASTVEDGIEVFNKYPRCAGIAYHIADAKVKKAAVVETSSKRVCVRYPMDGIKALWQSNHSNCYPGWMGYEGYNMVADQVLVNEIKDISTIQNWQDSLRDPYNFYIQAPSRFERYRQLLHEYYGDITVENAIKIMSDRYDPYTKLTRPKDDPSVSNNILCTICAKYPNTTFKADEPVGEFKAHVANMWSMIAYPETGEFWVAINDFPAEYGGYEEFNLKTLLGRDKE